MAETTAPTVQETETTDTERQSFVSVIKRRLLGGLRRVKSLTAKVGRGIKTAATATANTTKKVVVKGVEVTRTIVAAVVTIVALPVLLLSVSLLALWAAAMWTANKINPGWSQVIETEPQEEVKTAPTPSNTSQRPKGRPTPKRPRKQTNRRLSPVSA